MDNIISHFAIQGPVAEVKPLVEQLKVSQPVPSVSCDPGTRIGYTLSMCCPM